MINIRVAAGIFHITFESPNYGVVARVERMTLSEALEDLVGVFKEHQDACVEEMRAAGLIRSREKALS